MKVIRTKKALTAEMALLRAPGKDIGLVPTMGALHEGHATLVRQCVSENPVSVVSVFVNPAQFNDPSDLRDYPRTPVKDLELLGGLGCDMVFMPSEREMYPGPDTRTFDLGGLDRIMEGASRPGHFEGVARIVSKFFAMLKPTRAYFGQKDFQQLVIIKRLAGQMKNGPEIIACPIIREADGLAMSSRNRLLTESQRASAPFIFETLTASLQMKHSHGPADLKKWVESRFEGHPDFDLDYFEIVDTVTLQPVSTWDRTAQAAGCIAARMGGVRLIDNVIFD